MDIVEIKDSLEQKNLFKLESFQHQITDRLSAFTQKEPEVIFNWKDEKSEAKGFLVINSLKGGACGGGTRVHRDVTIDEVTTLAKIMEIKFAFSGPSIGGAKTGIKIPGDHPQKYDILSRWYKAISPLIKKYYGTGSDLNTDIHKINELLKSLDIHTSQEGIINAVTKGDQQKLKQAFANMKMLDTKINLNQICQTQLAELVTGFGVFASVDSFLKTKGETLENKRIFIQGTGNVGAASMWYFYQAGAKIIALTDKHGGAIFEHGISEEELTQIINHRSLENSQYLLDQQSFENKLSKQKLDIFIPAARSNIVSFEFIDQLINQGLSLISSGANHPFVESEYCYGQCSQILDKKLTVIPDFLANMGMARTFYYLMSNFEKTPSVEEIFSDIYKETEKAITQAYDLNQGQLMTASLYHLALNRI